MGTGFSWLLVRRDGRRGSIFTLLVSLGYLGSASCAGRSLSHDDRNGSGGSSTGGVSGGVGGATGGVGGGATGGVGAGATGGAMGKAGNWYGPEGGGAGNVPGNGGNGATGGAVVGGAGGSAGGSAGSGSLGCVDESSVSPNLVTCQGHFAHRPTASACPPPPSELLPTQEGAAGEGGAGSQGAHCDEPCMPGEACIWTAPDEAEVSACVSVCETDADCSVGSICACVPGLFLNPGDEGPGATVGVCRRSTCSVDADCAPGLLCISPFTRSDCDQPWPSEFHCQTPNDECAGGDQCGDRDCEYQNARFVCGDFTEHC